jgi:hypothetical protein
LWPLIAMIFGAVHPTSASLRETYLAETVQRAPGKISFARP